MTDRFSLRFASGERQGETVPIRAPRATLGRHPGNTLQVQDSSISGKHAELVVEPRGVTLRDLGSTNGTRIAGVKISEQLLAHGDRLAFGSVEVVFLDSEFAELVDTPPTARKPRAPAAAAEVGVERISADNLARSGKRSKVGMLVGLVLVLGGGGAAAFFLLGGEGGRTRRFTPPPVVPGNLVAGGDFEGEGLAGNWNSENPGAADFAQRGEARATGRDGVRSALEGGERARLVSDAVDVTPGRSLTLSASLRARGGAAGRVGVEFLPADDGDDAPGGTTAWSDMVVEVTQYQSLEFDAPVPPGARRARVVIEALASPDEGGSVDVDDVALVTGSAAATPDVKVGEFTLWLLGQPPQSATLHKISKPLLGDLHGVGGDPRRAHPLTRGEAARGIALSVSDSLGLSLRVEPEALRQGLASLGEGGYRDQSTSFVREAATGLLLARGKDLVALHFDEPVRLEGRPEGAGVRVEVSGAGATRAVLQLDFGADRSEAGNLAFAARKAEREGRLGDCLADWGELLERYPFDAALITEARETRARLEQAGLEELQVVSEAFVRAKFFRLIDLFRLCRDNAGAVGRKYAGSDVERKAEELLAEIEGSLGELETDLNKDEVARLQGILRVLQASEAPRLAAEVGGYLNSEYGVEN